MVYTKATLKAMNIAYEAHHGQKDKTGYPYIAHPLHLADQMTTEDTCVVALLHDVVEDTYLTFEDIEAAGFSKEQLDALKLLTHDDIPQNLSLEEREKIYLDYVRKIKENDIAKVVKIADLKHNSDLSRMLREPDEIDLKRAEKYKKALDILEN